MWYTIGLMKENAPLARRFPSEPLTVFEVPIRKSGEQLVATLSVDWNTDVSLTNACPLISLGMDDGVVERRFQYGLGGIPKGTSIGAWYIQRRNEKLQNPQNQQTFIDRAQVIARYIDMAQLQPVAARLEENQRKSAIVAGLATKILDDMLPNKQHLRIVR